jgi:hypothetical protein
VSNVHHSSKSNEWYTPPEYITAVKEVFGGRIDLDPCSSPEANKIVGAREFYCMKGEQSLWEGSVYCNPPGGKLDGKSSVNTFWDHAMEQRQNFAQLIFCCFNTNHLRQLQRDSGNIDDFAICVPRKRVRYVSPTGTAKAPPHASAFVCVPGDGNEYRTAWFGHVFSRFGAVWMPR